jgi:hypothetical protein
MSRSETRTDRPNRCTGSAPESMSRLTVRDETLRISAVSSMVRSLTGCRSLCALPTRIWTIARRGGSDARRSIRASLISAVVLGMSALSAILPRLAIGCRNLCRSLAPTPALPRRRKVDFRRLMVSDLVGLGADHGGGRVHGRRDFVSVEPWASKRRPIRPTGRTNDSMMRANERREVPKLHSGKRL